MYIFLLGIFFVILTIILAYSEPRRLLVGITANTGILLIILGLFLTTIPQFKDKTLEELLANGFLSILALLFFLYCAISGVFLIINGAILITKESIRVAHLLPLAFGCMNILSIVATFVMLAVDIPSNLVHICLFIYLFILGSSLYLPLMFMSFSAGAIIYAIKAKPKNCDYIIVLGCSVRNGKATPLLRARLEKAIKWFNAGGGKAQFILSGGQGADEVISEALAMKHYLIEQNIPTNKILLEDKSTSTRENLLFSKDIADSFGTGHSCVFVTNNFHVFRSAILARSIGFSAEGIGGKTANYYFPAAFLREYIGTIFNYKLLAAIHVALILVLSYMMSFVWA